MEKYGKKRRSGARSRPFEKLGSDTTAFEEVVVPELEKIAKTYAPRHNFWTSYEEAVLRKYYGKVPIEALVRFYNRTENAIYHQARKLGMVESKKRPMDSLE